jgi:hypothetical protein
MLNFSIAGCPCIVLRADSVRFHAGRDARNRSTHISVDRAALYSTE